ncbi:hypothetical protein VNI00_014664 [Paramarasmius palmivorus]|uniref:Uncharacterized protein n=1 Tax=Paramarasmius palmivorus TaxID=297713 RepID=A0AAW0BRQ8_9AGAR
MSAPLEPLKTPEQGKAAPKLARPHNLNPGSAGASEHLASCTVARIAPYHAHDLSNIQTCAIENLLIHLLCKIQTSKPEKCGRQLLDELLTLVLPLANGTNEKASPEAYAMKEELER